MTGNEATVWGISEQDGADFLEKRYMAIAWKEMGDLTKLGNAIASFNSKFKEEYPDVIERVVSDNSKILYQFSYVINEGDYVIYNTNKNNMIHIGKVIGKYVFNNEANTYAHIHPVKWLKHIPKKYFSKNALREIDNSKPLFIIEKYAHEFISFLDINRNYVNEKHSDWEKARITQLLSYMSDCQQGMRDLNGQILTVLTVVSSLLSLLFGISIFRIGDGEVAEQLLNLPKGEGPFDGRLYDILNHLILRRRLFFWLTTIIFIATVLYVIFLAIEAVLRYHYSQHLADRLHTIIPGTADDIDRNALLTFEQFEGPIRTLNYMHLCTSHSMFNFFACYVSGGLASAFCLGLVLTQYVLLTKIEWYDHLLLSITILILVVAIILFVRFYACAYVISDKAFKIGNENLEVRKGLAGVNAELYKSAKEFRSFFHYLILPRKDSILKVFLIIYGFFVATELVDDFYPTHLVYIVFVYEFLLYQARYQFNDIRGISEGVSGYENRKRLVDYIASDKPFRIRMSIIMVVGRIALAAIMILFLGRSIKLELMVMLILLVILTVAYETVRTKKMGWFTIIISGLGFPLRFIVGALAASRELVWECPLRDKILIILAFWLWGMTVSLMTWVREVDDLIIKDKIGEKNKHKKEHYNIIYSIIRERRAEIEEDKSVFSYKVGMDIWSICYFLLLVLLAIYRLIYIKHLFLLIIPLISIIIAVCIYINNDNRFMNLFCIFVTILLDIYGAWLFNGMIQGVLLYNILLLAIIFSVCIVKRESREEIMIYNIFPDIIKFIIGKEAYDGLKLKIED